MFYSGGLLNLFYKWCLYDKCEFIVSVICRLSSRSQAGTTRWYRTFLIRWWGSCWWAAATKVLRVAKEGGAGVSPSTGCGSMCGGGRGRGMPHGNNHGPGCCITPHYHTTLTTRLRLSDHERHRTAAEHDTARDRLTDSRINRRTHWRAHYLAADAATTWPISCVPV